MEDKPTQFLQSLLCSNRILQCKLALLFILFVEVFKILKS